MGCLRLTYAENESPLRISREEKPVPQNWQVWTAEKGEKETKECEVAQNGGDGDGTFWSSTGNVLGFLLGVGPSVQVYGPDSDESKAMNLSPGVDEAVALYYKKGKGVKSTYEFSPRWENGKLVNTEGTWERHQAANSPVRLVTGGYTYWVSGGADGSLSIMIGNQMSANSLLGHIGDYFGVNVNYSRAPIAQPQPLSTTYQFFLINRPGK